MVSFIMSLQTVQLCIMSTGLALAFAASPINGNNDAVQLATPNQFPYMVEITNFEKRTANICSGAIIDSHTILTSASCMSETNDPTELEVVLAGRKKKVEIQKIYKHPKYNIFQSAGVTSADIAILKTNWTIDINGYSSENVKLQSSNSGVDKYAGKSAVLAASDLQNFSRNDALSFTEIKIMRQSSCKKIWPKKELKLQDTQVCVEANVACNRGGGGAVTISDKGIPTVVAIAPGYDHCQSGKPIVYTRIGPYVDWIKKIKF